MSGPSTKLTPPQVLADFLREASFHFRLNRDELRAMTSLIGFAQSGASKKKRSAVSRGIVSALEALQSDDDPLAEVDEPMSPAETVIEAAWAEAESQANREILLKDSISASEVAELTGRSRQAIEQMRRANRLIALRGENKWAYPRWQFDPNAPGEVVPGLAEVIELLGFSAAGAAFWLLQPSERLGATPIDLLRRRQTESVVQLALETGYMP